jgi:hypothetical protein
LRERLDKTLTAPLTPAMIVLLAQLKERKAKKMPNRKRRAPRQNG